MNRVLSCPVWLSVLAVLAPRPVSANTAQLAAHLWKSDTLVMEPVLVRVEIRNDSRAPVAMVPPYMNCYQRGYWPLTLTVTGADGSAVPNGWEGGNGSDGSNHHAERYHPAPCGVCPVVGGATRLRRLGRRGGSMHTPPRTCGTT